MTVILYFLTKFPEELAKLRSELAPLMTRTAETGVSFPTEKLASLDHLNGVINEALRLYPVVPTLTYRKAPPQGVSIAGTFIPGGTDVWTPQYTIGRSEEIYQEPNRFLPERWYEYPEMAKNPSAFAPFLIGKPTKPTLVTSNRVLTMTCNSTGPYNCIGKPLALQTIRSTIAKLVCTFEIAFPPGEDGSGFEEGIKDRWILGVPKLPLTLLKRLSQ